MATTRARTISVWTEVRNGDNTLPAQQWRVLFHEELPLGPLFTRDAHQIKSAR